MSLVEPLPSRVTPPPVRRPGRPRTKNVRRAIGLTTKVRGAIDRMCYDGMTRPEAAQAVGLSDNSLRIAFRNPVVLKHYNECLEVLRTSERPRSVRKIAHLRDKAGSERVQLEAAKYLDGGAERAAGVVVNVGVNVQPGYLVALPSDVSEPARQMLKLAGSHANVLDQSQSVPDDDGGTP